MARRAPRLWTLRGLVLVAMLLPLENALFSERLEGDLGAVAEARRRRRTPRARRRLGAKLFRQAQRMMSQGQYKRAIHAFNRSFGLLPTVTPGGRLSWLGNRDGVATGIHFAW